MRQPRSCAWKLSGRSILVIGIAVLVAGLHAVTVVGQDTDPWCLRIVVDTEADWTVVSLSGATWNVTGYEILEGHIAPDLRITPGPDLGINKRQLDLTRVAVSFQVSLAETSDSIELTIGKGHIGTTVVTVFDCSGAEERLVDQFTHIGIAPDPNPLNQRSYSLFLAAPLAVVSQAFLPRGPVEPSELGGLWETATSTYSIQVDRTGLVLEGLDEPLRATGFLVGTKLNVWYQQAGTTHGWEAQILVDESGWPIRLEWDDGVVMDRVTSGASIPARTIPTTWRDDFASILDSAWRWVREDSSHWSLTDRPGHLRIETQQGGLSTSSAKNLLLRDIPTGSFTVETKVEFDATQDFQAAGLVLYRDDLTYFSLLCEFTAESVGRGVYMDHVVSGETMSFDAKSALGGSSIVHLKLEVDGSLVRVYHSLDGRTWMHADTERLNWQPVSVGLVVMTRDQPTPSIPADFDYVAVNSTEVAQPAVAPARTPLPTETVLGACCVSNGQCLATSEQACTAMSGTLIAGATCSDAGCGSSEPEELSPCCLPSGLCVMKTEEDCAALSGTPTSDASCATAVCASPPQPATLYACCLPDGSCTETTGAECVAMDGETPGQESCSLAQCPQPPTTYTLTMEVEGSGTTAPLAGAHTYLEGFWIEITAQANPGWEFHHWTGDVDDTANPTTFVLMDQDQTVTAYFVELPPEAPYACWHHFAGSNEPTLADATEFQCIGVTSPAECTGALDIYDPVPCSSSEPPIACLLYDGSCVTVGNFEECAAKLIAMAGDFYVPCYIQEFGSHTCSTLPAGYYPDFACCLHDGSCSDQYSSEPECVEAGGRIGWGCYDTCASVDCAYGGACCLPDGTCQEFPNELQCEAAGGSQWVHWHWGESCRSGLCRVTGACCKASGDCEDGVTEIDCIEASVVGTPDQVVYWEEGASCDDVDCTGTCCLRSGAYEGTCDRVEWCFEDLTLWECSKQVPIGPMVASWTSGSGWHEGRWLLWWWAGPSQPDFGCRDCKCD